MGSNEDNEEKPIHLVSLEGFYMGRYPVTNREYGFFLEETGYHEPNYWTDRSYNQPDQPVVGVLSGIKCLRAACKLSINVKTNRDIPALFSPRGKLHRAFPPIMGIENTICFLQIRRKVELSEF